MAEESTAAFYRYHVYWRGEDPDGEVVRFLFAITDTVSLDEEENWDPSLAVDRERGVFTAPFRTGDACVARTTIIAEARR